MSKFEVYNSVERANKVLSFLKSTTYTESNKCYIITGRRGLTELLCQAEKDEECNVEEFENTLTLNYPGSAYSTVIINDILDDRGRNKLLHDNGGTVSSYDYTIFSTNFYLGSRYFPAFKKWVQ